MTKRHFEAFAEEIRGAVTAGQLTVKEAEATAWLVAKVGQRFNPLFNADRFYQAAGIQREKGVGSCQ